MRNVNAGTVELPPRNVTESLDIPRNRARLPAAGLLAVAVAACANPELSDGQFRDDVLSEVDLTEIFEGAQPVEAAFVMFEPSAGWTIHNRERAEQRFIPASTFKIPNTLIALESGVATDADFTIAFDSIRDRRDGFWTPEWSRDQTLRLAFQNSVYWFYQEVARRVGLERMGEYLSLFSYGNQDMGGGVHRFWLEGDLRISPREQVDFLRNFYEGRLGVSPRSTAILKEIMVLESGLGYVLSGKTGTADVTPTRELAWLVGYLERDGSVYYFALNMEGEEVWERWGQPAARRELVVSIFRELGVVPGE